MNMIDLLFGRGEALGIWQMTARAVLTFFICLLLIRMGGMRVVGKRSAFDTIILITMGSLLARGIVGASSYSATVVASFFMIVANRLVAWLAAKNKRMQQLVTGEALLICSDGHILWENMKTAALSREDLMESLRLETGSEDLSAIRRAYIETNGRISFLLK